MNSDRNRHRIIALGLMAIGLAFEAPAIVAADPPANATVDQTALKPSTERTLRLPEKPYRYAGIDLPAHFKTESARRFDNTPRDNPVTDAGATLGRVLFYDTRLSANNLWRVLHAMCKHAPSPTPSVSAKGTKAN